MEIFDLIILGAGGVGSAALYDATKRGLKTLCLEQFTLGHTFGGTHGETRAFRMAYYENPDYIPLLKKAYSEWKSFEQKTGKKLFVENGVLEIAYSESGMISDAIAGAQKYGIPCYPYSATQIQNTFPEFYISDNMMGIFQPQAGFLYVDDCVKTFIHEAVTQGATIIYGEKVISWHIDLEQKIIIKTQKNTYIGRCLIVAAGSWAPEIFPELNLPITVVQKKLIWAQATPPRYLSTPCFPYHLKEGIFYGFPNIGGHIKVARHNGGMPMKANTTNDNEESVAIHSFIQKYLKVDSVPHFKEKNCLYDMTPDKQFIIDSHPSYPQISFATGLSGHGYKMCNVIGSILIDLVTKQSTDYDISFLSMKRFSCE